MKIAAILFACLIAYSMADAGDDDGSSGQAGAEGSVRQQPISSQSAGSSRFIPATGTAPRRTSTTTSGTSSLLRLIVLFSIINSMTTTKAPEAPAETTTAMDTTTATTVVTTPSPYAGWASYGNCVYQMQTSPKTATAAKTSCVSKKATLASKGFQGLNSASRKELITAAGGLSQTFWVDVTADETNPAGAIDVATDTYNVANSPNDPSGDGITLELVPGNTGTGLCGRFDATDTDKLQFESCNVATRAFFYLCEFCGTV